MSSELQTKDLEEKHKFLNFDVKRKIILKCVSDKLDVTAWVKLLLTQDILQRPTHVNAVSDP
jgi:hypothetical protein